MNSRNTRVLNAVALGAALLLPVQQLRAEMVSTEDLTAQPGAGTARDQARQGGGRTEVEAGLIARGVDAQLARERVAALTEAEVGALAGKLDQLPAGARLTKTEFVLLLLVIVLVVLVL